MIMSRTSDMPLPIESIEEMIRNVHFYGTGWEICRAGDRTDIDGTTWPSKDSFLVIKPIKPATPSASPPPTDD